MPASSLDRPMLVPLLCLAVVVLAAAAGLLIQPDLARTGLVENGPVETVSVVLHFLAAGVALWLWRRGSAVSGVLAFAELLMALREMDVHRAFTTFGVFTTRLYARPDVPLAEKVGAAAAVLAIVALMLLALWNSRAELRALAADRAAALRGLIAVAVFVVVLKEIDGLPRMLARVGVILSERADILSHSIEELGEMALPVLVMTVLLQLVRSTAAAPAALTLPSCDARA